MCVYVDMDVLSLTLLQEGCLQLARSSILLYSPASAPLHLWCKLCM